MAIVTVGVIVKSALLVLPLALKNFVGGFGAGLPAGTANGGEYEMLFDKFAQVVGLHDTVLMVEAEVDNVCVPAVNVVEVIVKFQP